MCDVAAGVYNGAETLQMCRQTGISLQLASPRLGQYVIHIAWPAPQQYWSSAGFDSVDKICVFLTSGGASMYATFSSS